MKRSTHLLLLATMAFGLPGCSIDGRSAEERAHASFEDNHFLDTRIHLANAIEKEPNNPELRHLLGKTSLALGDGKVAETAFKKAIEKDEKLASEIYPYLAHAYLQQQKPEEALDLIRKIKDKDHYALRLLAQAKLQIGAMPEAWEALEKAISIAPEDADILALAGQYQLAVGNLEEARRYAGRSLASPSPSVESYLLQGRIHSIQGDLNKSLEQYNTASKRFRDHVRIYISQAAIYADIQDTKKMEAAISDVERISPGHQSAVYIMARYSLMRGDIDKAYELAQSLEGASQNNPPLLMLLGEIQTQKGNFQQAISHLRGYLRLVPNHPTASHLLAKALDKNGDYNNAMAVIKGAISRAYSPKPIVDYAATLAEKTNHPNLSLIEKRAQNPALSNIEDQLVQIQKVSEKEDWLAASNIYDALIANEFSNHPMLLNNAAIAHFRIGNGERALELAKRAYELTPDDPSVLDSLGWIQLNVAEDRAGSLQLLNRAFLLDPGNMQIRLHLAQALALNGRKTEARTHLKRVMAVVDSKYHKEFDRILAML